MAVSYYFALETDAQEQRRETAYARAITALLDAAAERSHEELYVLLTT